MIKGGKYLAEEVKELTVLLSLSLSVNIAFSIQRENTIINWFLLRVGVNDKTINEK